MSHVWESSGILRHRSLYSWGELRAKNKSDGGLKWHWANPFKEAWWGKSADHQRPVTVSQRKVLSQVLATLFIIFFCLRIWSSSESLLSSKHRIYGKLEIDPHFPWRLNFSLSGMHSLALIKLHGSTWILEFNSWQEGQRLKDQFFMLWMGKLRHLAQNMAGSGLEFRSFVPSHFSLMLTWMSRLGIVGPKQEVSEM